MSDNQTKDKIRNLGTKERESFVDLLKKMNLPISDRVQKALELWKEGDGQVASVDAALEKAKKKAEGKQIHFVIFIVTPSVQKAPEFFVNMFPA